MDEIDQKAPGGASSMSIPVDAFAFELLHGTSLVGDLFDSAMCNSRILCQRYPLLADAVGRAESALADLYQVAGDVWHAEAKRAEAGNAP